MAESVEVEDGLLDIPQPDNSMSPAEGPLAHSAPTLTIDELLSTRLETVTLEQISGCLSSRPAAEIPEICLKLLKRDMEDAGKAKGMLRIGILGSQASSNALEGKIQKENLTYTTDEDLGKILDSISEDERRSLRTHAELLSLEWKLEAWTAFAPYAAGPTSDEYVNGSSRPTEVVPVLDENEDADVELDDPWETNEETMDDIDDPWKDAGSDVGSEGKQAVRAITEPTQGSPQRGDDTEEPPLSLSAFLHQSIIQSALDFASTAYLTGLSVLRSRYPEILFPIRTVLVEACPDWVSPNELAIAGLLPVLGGDGNEVGWPGQDQTKSSLLAERLCALMVTNTLPSLVHGSKEFMASGEIEEWYTSHILSLDQSGLVDVQLAWVQQAESTGITGLDELGEDLSLLSRLVYESNLSTEAYDRWALETWRNSSATDIISAYLSSSTPDTVVEDVNTRILPYLYVLEARAERSGQPDNTLIERYLCETILSLPLDLSLPIFESSKATLPKSDRIIKDDLNVARLALACLYGSDQRDVWGLMSAIFECLPVWELSGRNPEDDAELTSTTLESIATFIRPSASQPNPPRAADLMMFFRPLPFASLSRALDILDVHLESGEILARWDVPVQLRFLLQSSRDGKEQAELAEKMVRRATASGVRAGLRGAEKTRLGGRDGGEEAKWARLWDDMLRLNGSGDQLLRGAFGMVDGEELMRVYLGGLIRSGKLDIARKTVNRLKVDYKLKEDTLEAVVLATSRELYEGAETGNLNAGDMKIGYDCLAIAPSTPAITTERSFIEATSRLSTFSLPSFSAHGGTLSPQEIRHTKNRLDLISSVLTHSPDAYKHESMILDLSSKLELSTRIEKGRIWGMMARSAAVAGDWEIGDEYVCKASEVVKELSKRDSGRNRKKPSDPEAESSELRAVKEDCWRTAVTIGSAGDYSEIGRKMDLLGLGIELCPPSEVPGVLAKWKKVEDGRIKLDAAAKRRRVGGIKGEGGGGHKRITSASSSTAWASPKFDLDGIVSSPTMAEERVLGSRTAARAAKMAFDITGRLGSHLPQLPRTASPSAPGFNLSRTGTRTGSSSGERSSSAEGKRGSGEYTRALEGLLGAEEKDGGQPLGMEDVERVRRGARRALRQGVGWLLGAEEGEMG